MFHCAMTDTDVDHSLKTEEELLNEYQKLSRHLAFFWMFRPRNKALYTAYPGTVKELQRRVNFLEDILQIPDGDQFDSDKYDQNEIN